MRPRKTSVKGSGVLKGALARAGPGLFHARIGAAAHGCFGVWRASGIAAYELLTEDCLPARIDRLHERFGRRCRPVMVTDPLVFWNKMSDLPSPLKSTVPITCQLGSTVCTRGSAAGVVPFTSQMATEPSVF